MLDKLPTKTFEEKTFHERCINDVYALTFWERWMKRFGRRFVQKLATMLWESSLFPVKTLCWPAGRVSLEFITSAHTLTAGLLFLAWFQRSRAADCNQRVRMGWNVPCAEFTVQHLKPHCVRASSLLMLISLESLRTWMDGDICACSQQIVCDPVTLVLVLNARAAQYHTNGTARAKHSKKEKPVMRSL